VEWQVVPIQSAQAVTEERGDLIKEYYLNAALQPQKVIECDGDPIYWVGDVRKNNTDSKHKIGKFDFFITVAGRDNKYHVVEHGIFSEAFEAQIMRFIANTYDQSTDQIKQKLTEIKVESSQILKSTIFSDQQFNKLFDEVK